MAIQFNPNALSIFANVNFGQTDAIANLNGEKDGLVQKGTRGLGLLAWARSGKTQDRNNAVRTEFLKALGQAFNIKGVSEDDGGKTTFSDGFMDRLEKLLGPEIFKRADFGINADGEVKSGRPLTQRRIRAIVNAARAKGVGEDDESDDGGPNFFEFNIDRDKPVDGNHAVGKAGDVKFETPDFVKDLPEATQKEFMAFYKAAVNKSIAGGVWKENCDSALKALFDKIGGDPDERKVLVELIAGGKAGFLNGGKVPSLEDALAYADKVKPVLQKIVQYSKDNGEEFAHVVLATVKSMDELVSADDLMPIEKQELGDIRDGADLFINNYHFSNVTSAEELSGKLTSFKEDVLKTFNTRCPGSANGCTPAMLAVKKNYYLYMAFNKMELRGYFAGLLEKYYKDLVTTHGQKELVDMILPQFEKRFELVIDRDF